MKSVTISIGDYDFEVLDQIFEKDIDFKPKDPRDELIIKILEQVRDNPKIDLGTDQIVND